VKIRGFRIELGEVEAALLGHPDVRLAAAAVRDDPVAGPRLVGHVVLAEAARTRPEQLRAHVAGVLPEHLVPAAVLVLDSLPLTPSGKLDRAALPDADYGAARRDRRPPGTERERVLTALFADVLGLPEVGVDDNFFELGGHSLLATRLIGRANAELPAELVVRDLFDAATPAGLAARVRTAPARTATTTRSRLRPMRGGGDR
jgi:hypothetical protein